MRTSTLKTIAMIMTLLSGAALLATILAAVLSYFCAGKNCCEFSTENGGATVIFSAIKPEPRAFIIRGINFILALLSWLLLCHKTKR